jgi:hypothetical protein
MSPWGLRTETREAEQRSHRALFPTPSGPSTPILQYCNIAILQYSNIAKISCFGTHLTIRPFGHPPIRPLLNSVRGCREKGSSIFICIYSALPFCWLPSPRPNPSTPPSTPPPAALKSSLSPSSPSSPSYPTDLTRIHPRELIPLKLPLVPISDPLTSCDGTNGHLRDRSIAPSGPRAPY